MTFAMLKDDWLYTEGVIDAGFRYGPDRSLSEDAPEAPAAGVKVRSGNPTQEQIAVAASTFGYRVTDKLFTVWANTLRATPSDEASVQILPIENDRLLVAGVTWIIKSVKLTMYDAQFICYCQQSQSTVDNHG